MKALQQRSPPLPSRLSTFAFSFYYGLEDAGIGIFAAIASKDVNLDSIQREFDLQIDLIKSELISDEEFNKARNKFENNFVSSNSSIEGIANSLARYYMLYGDVNLINNEIDIYRSITREEIKTVANKYLNADQRLILEYLPESDKE